MYKVGDYVQIRNDLKCGEYTNKKGESIRCVEPMLEYKGNMAQITSMFVYGVNFFGDRFPTTYKLMINDKIVIWRWSDEMLLPITNSIKKLLEEKTN